MGLAAVIGLFILFLGGALLFLQELKRFRQDRAATPPPTPEEAAKDPWNARMVILVAGLSIVGAIVALWASDEFSRASSASQQAVEEATQYQVVKSEQDGYIDFGAQLAETYQEHTVDESSLYAEAARAWSQGKTAVALELESQARVQGAAERALMPGFTCYWPYLPAAGGVVDYDVAQEQASELEDPCVLPDQDPTALRTLDQAHQQAIEATAAADRSDAEKAILVGAFVIMAVFFVTISYLGWRHRRLLSLAPGVLAIAGALSVAVVVLA